MTIIAIIAITIAALMLVAWATQPEPSRATTDAPAPFNRWHCRACGRYHEAELAGCPDYAVTGGYRD